MTTERQSTQTAAGQPAEGNAAPTIQIPRVLTVKELGDLMRLSPVEVIKDLMKNGVMATINQNIDYDTAAIVAHDLGFEPVEAAVEEVAEEAPEQPAAAPAEEEEDAAALKELVARGQ